MASRLGREDWKSVLLAGVARQQSLELFFGMLVVAGAIVWRRRSRRLTLIEGDS